MAPSDFDAAAGFLTVAAMIFLGMFFVIIAMSFQATADYQRKVKKSRPHLLVSHRILGRYGATVRGTKFVGFMESLWRNGYGDYYLLVTIEGEKPYTRPLDKKAARLFIERHATAEEAAGLLRDFMGIHRTPDRAKPEKR